jgi:DNA-binding phage protein
LLKAALGDIARAKGMTEIAKAVWSWAGKSLQLAVAGW